jgi:regulator of sirC expression with transglutaminase-like and TPR domain
VAFKSDFPRPVAGRWPRPDPLGVSLRAAVEVEPIALAEAALVIARLEHPHLDAAASLSVLEDLGARATERLKDVDRADLAGRVLRLNRFVYGECGFAGNREWYSDIRNSMLNLVLDRRVGIPITLALVYIEVARRAGVAVHGIAFPGHFLLRVPADQGSRRSPVAGARREPEADLVLDPFDGGRFMSEADCRILLNSQLGDEVPFDPRLLRPCSGAHLVARLLNNLKRAYLDLRAYAYARRVTDLLLAIDPTLLSELRDRGLLSYHLDDFPAALRDLEDYLQLNTWADGGDRDEREQLQTHVSALRRRVGSLN